MSEAGSTRTIWLPGAFLTRESDLEFDNVHKCMSSNAGMSTPSVDNGEWNAIVNGLIGECT